MLIDRKSPLRSIPTSINEETSLLLSTFRVTAEMTDLAYRRLTITCNLTAVDRLAGGNQPDLMPLLLDAWFVINSMAQLNRLVGRLKSLGDRNTLRAFVNKSADCKYLRDMFQHVDELAPDFLRARRPAHGALGWIWTDPTQPSVAYSFICIGGSLRGTFDDLPLENPSGRFVRSPVDWVTLSGWWRDLKKRQPPRLISVNMSEMMLSLEKAVDALEQAVKDQPGRSVHSGSDLLLLLRLDAKPT